MRLKGIMLLINFKFSFDSLFKEARTAMEIEKFKSFEVKDNVLYYNGRVCVPKFEKTHSQYYELSSGHSNSRPSKFSKNLYGSETPLLLARNEKNIKKYVERCLKCQVSKSEQAKSFGLLKPLDVPNLKSESVSMNFIVRLPKTKSNFDIIMAVVDRLTKIAHFIPAITTVTAYGVAELFMRENFKYHEILIKTVSL